MNLLERIKRSWKVFQDTQGDIILLEGDKKDLIRDSLTGLLDRTTLEEVWSQEMEIAKRYDLSLSLGFFDVNDFKKINDQYGHQEGDKTLKKIADVLRKTLREADISFRYGGDEFLIIFPETSAEEAKEATRRISNGVKEETRVSIAWGIANWQGSTLEELIRRADEEVYEKKNK